MFFYKFLLVLLSYGHLNIFLSQNIYPEISGNDFYYILLLIRISILYSILYWTDGCKEYMLLHIAAYYLLFNKSNIPLSILIIFTYLSVRKNIFYKGIFILLLFSHINKSLDIISLIKPVDKSSYMIFPIKFLSKKLQYFIKIYNLKQHLYISFTEEPNIFAISLCDGGIFFSINNIFTEKMFYLIVHEAYHFLNKHTQMTNIANFIIRLSVLFLLYVYYRRNSIKLSYEKITSYLIKLSIICNLLINCLSIYLEYKSDMFSRAVKLNREMRSGLYTYFLLDKDLQQPYYFNIIHSMFTKSHPPNHLRLNYLSYIFK